MRILKLRGIVLLAALTFLLQGCWFIYIPGSVTSAVSDSITGSEGSHCVGPNAKVGDIILIPGSGRGTIKSLSGTSTRCTNPEYPIRALLAFATAAAESSTTAIRPARRVSISLPIGWTELPIPPNWATPDAILYATNRTIDAGMFLSATRREGITDFASFANTKRASQINSLDDPQPSELIPIDVNEKKSFRFTVAGVSQTAAKIKMTYLVTVVEGNVEIATLSTWTTTANFQTQLPGFELLTFNINGL